MMATEATSENIATTSITPDHELNPTKTPSQDVPSEQPVVNGTSEKDELKPYNEHLEPNAVNSAEVSVSGGSDTEATKAETSKATGEEKGHGRTTSTVKKFTSFKPVSVNKTFLAAKGATTATPSKLGDKGTPGLTTTQTGPSATGASARPRLVAKSGSGLRDSAPKASGTANGGKPGAPDANAVWNKNRPAPAPEPKRFTDEELKQRYGIHLATRLQSDDPGKQANWADIDDDDDDWAPETIEWTDGTKITLPTAEETQVPTHEPIPAVVEKVIENIKPKSPAPPQASASPTIRPSVFGGRTGLVLKGAAEKPTLVAKPPGPPTPVKSPWASLPPVERVAPVAIDLPQQPQPSRFSQRDPHGFHGMPPPAKEIAADDFSRSWRESGDSRRELFNSQSGRYEPVNDNRRGSMRNDARAHQPAVLQRPLNQDGPAEPSAAFQTHRAGGQDGAFGRRRTSSNVSGGSGNFMRRMSRGDMPPPHELLGPRRGSLAAVSDEPASPRNFSPSGQFPNSRGHQQWQSRASPVISHTSPQSAHGQVVPPSATSTTDNQSQPTSAVFEDPLEVQKKVMQEKRAIAIARRKDEEAREEEAKRARIAAKLASMGPAPETKKKEAPKEEKVAPTQIQTREAKEPTYTQTKPANMEETFESKPAPSQSTAEVSLPTPSLDGSSADKESLSQNNRPNGIHRPQDQNSQESSSQWQNNNSSYNKSWAQPAQQTSRNVWGPPTNDRTLGNGTFNPELSRVLEMPSTSHPGPIGPPNRGNAQQGQGREPYNSRPAPIGPPNRRQMPQVDPTARAAVANSGWGSLPSRIAQEDKQLAQQQDTQRARINELREQGLVEEASKTVLQDTWRQVSIREDGTRGKIEANHKTVHGGDDSQSRGIYEEQDNAQRRPLDASAQQPPFNEAWQSTSNVNAAAPGRTSRFFNNNNNRDVRMEEHQMVPERPGSPTPPPPTMAGHPAYDGDSAHPHVSLPRPPPVVKLPPATVLAPIGPPARPVSFAAAVSTPAVPLISHSNFSQNRASQFQDVRKQEPIAAGNWQEKINSLVGRKNSPPKSHALAVDSSSKHALEVPNHQSSATVSLPSLVLGDLATEAGAVESKPAAEECFEEQEMGSLPNIKVPLKAPEAGWNLAQPQPKMLPKKFQVNQSTSVEPLPFPQPVTNNNVTLTVKVPGQEDAKNITVPATTRQKSNPRRGGSRGSGNSRQPSSNHSRGGRREGSNNFPASPSLDNSSVSSNPNASNRSSRGRGFGNNWNRNTSTPVHT